MEIDLEREPGDALTDDCEHGVWEDCMNCVHCGRCRESLDDEDVCAECILEAKAAASDGARS